MADDHGRLSGIEIFADLQPQDIDRVARRCRWRRYHTDQQILGHLEHSRDVYFIVEGQVRATAFSLAGKEVQYRNINSGKIFGEYSAIDGKLRSANVVALEDSLVASLPADAFLDFLHGHPEVAIATLRLLTGQIRMLTERVFEFSALASKNRLHAELLRLAREHMRDDNSAAISPFPTHAEIGRRITCNRAAVTRELSAMASAGIVERQGSTLVVPDVRRLEHLVKEVLGDQLDQIDQHRTPVPANPTGLP